MVWLENANMLAKALKLIKAEIDWYFSFRVIVLHS